MVVKFRIRKIQVARRIVQITVVLMILAVPVMARYNNFLMARELDETLENWDGTLQGELLEGIDNVMRVLPDGEEPPLEPGMEPRRNRNAALDRAQSLRGGIWSMQIGAVSMTDPLAALESIASSHSITTVLLISLILPVLIALLMGRVFCSWVCPMGLLLEFSDKLRGVLKFLELAPRDYKVSRLTKYTLLVVGLLTSALIGLPVLGYIYPPAILSRELHDFVMEMFDYAEFNGPGFFAGGLTWMSFLILGIAVFEVTVSRRWWCRYICPGAAVYCLLGAARPIRVRRNADSCTKCGECVRVCPMALAPMVDKMGIECDNCGVCVSHCDDHALGYTLMGKRKTTNDANGGVPNA